MNTAKRSSDVVAKMDHVLHEMCQPLTVLRCRLELGMLRDEPEAMREAVRAGLDECLRLNGAVASMRDVVRQAMSIQDAMQPDVRESGSYK